MSVSQHSWSLLAEDCRGCCLEKATHGRLPISGNPVFTEPVPHKRPKTCVPAASGTEAQLLPAPCIGPQDPRPKRKEPQQVGPAASTHLLPSLWRMGCAPQNFQSCTSEGFADFPSLHPPPPGPLLTTPGAFLGTSEAVSSHHSNCPTHQRMEITFHDGSSDVAIFCVDQNNKTNQTLSV